MLRSRAVRVVAAVLLAGSTLATSSCSFVYVRGAPRGAPRGMSFVECQGSYAAPVFDVVASFSPVFFIFLPSAIYGFAKLTSCEKAQREVTAAVAQLADTPEGLRPDVTLSTVTVELDQHGDTLRVGETARAQGAALTKAGAKIDKRLFLWSSDAVAVVGVDTAGTLRAYAAGAATISAMSGGVTGTRRLVVVP